MFTRRIRALIFIGIALVLIVAALVAATDEQSENKNVTFALVILGLASLVDPVKAAFDWLFARTESQEEDNRKKLIGIVRSTWIEGVLKDALQDAPFDVPVTTTPEKAGQSAGYEQVQIPARQPETPRPTGLFGMVKAIFRRSPTETESIASTPDALAKVFNSVNKKLLILGAPGSGKTVILLQLAQRLLDDAEKDKFCSVPVVLNLSSWAGTGKAIRDWIIDELQRTPYGVPKKLGEDLIKGDQLIYLLDGLDEVAEDHRKECLTKLNAFITPERQIAVCSRIAEYDELATELKTHNAIEVQPLSSEQFESYLKQYVQPANAENIFKMLRADNDVWQEANKPLFLNILISTYRGGRPFAPEAAQGNTQQRVQRLIIEPYITRQLQNSPETPPFTNEDIRRYLSWIGWQLKKHEKSVFYIEMLQPDWLTHYERLFNIVSAMLVGLLFGLEFWLLFELVDGLRLGLLFGLLGGLFGGGTGIDIEKKLTMSVKRIRDGLLFGLGSGLRVGLKSGLLLGLFLGLLLGLKGGLDSEFLFRMLFGMIGGLMLGLTFGLTFGLSLGFVVGLNNQSSIAARTAYNQGWRDTLLFVLVSVVVCGLPFGLVGGLRSGLAGGLPFGLLFGLGDAVKHLILRLFLYREGSAPPRLDTLLIYACKRRIMRRIGGSAIFIHRYILEYFADYYEAHYLKK